MEKLNALFPESVMKPSAATIRLSRIFDEKAALELLVHLELLLDRGIWRITLDFSGTRRVFEEALRIFWRAHERWAEGPVEFSLRAIHLPPPFARSLALRGLTINRRILEVEYPVAFSPREGDRPPGAESSTGPGQPPRQGVLLCTGCEHPLHTKGPGLYACPECGTHFHVDGEGRSVAYEPLYRMGTEGRQTGR